MSCIGSSKLGDETYGSLEMNVTTYVKTQTGYWPGAGYGYYYQPITYPFTVEKDMYGNLVLYLYSYGSKLFIDVRDEQGRYYYYLSEYNKDDCFGEYGKH